MGKAQFVLLAVFLSFSVPSLGGCGYLVGTAVNAIDGYAGEKAAQRRRADELKPELTEMVEDQKTINKLCWEQVIDPVFSACQPTMKTAQTSCHQSSGDKQRCVATILAGNPDCARIATQFTACLKLAAGAGTDTSEIQAAESSACVEEAARQDDACAAAVRQSKDDARVMQRVLAQPVVTSPPRTIVVKSPSYTSCTGLGNTVNCYSY